MKLEKRKHDNKFLVQIAEGEDEDEWLFEKSVMSGLLRYNLPHFIFSMKIFFCNCRGNDNDNTCKSLFYLSRCYSLHIVGLTEPTI